MKKITILLLFLVLTVGNAQQREQTIKGIISDGVSPIQAVNISVSGTDIGTTSDKNGGYEIKAQPSDVLEFSYVGMHTIKIIVEDVTTRLNIKLYPKFEKLDEVVVRVSKRKTQRDLAIDYAIDKSIVNTSFGYISREATAYRIGVIDGSELNNAAVDILSAIAGKLPGMRIRSYQNPRTQFTERALFMGAGGSLPAVFEVDGILYADLIPTWLDINNIERIGVLPGLQATWRFGFIAAGGVVFVNTKNGAHGAKEEGGLPYDRAKLRNNVFDEDVLGATSLLQANPIYLRELHSATTISEAENVYKQNRLKYENSPYFFIDSYAFFMEKAHHKFAKEIADKAIKKAEPNPMLLKAWVYYFEAHGELIAANEIYEKIFILRPSYIQSYRDLAKSYREVGNFKKSASMYARYQYLRDKEFLTVADSAHINTIIERESDNLVALEGDKVLDGSNSFKRVEKFTEFDGTRLVFEWNDSEAEFDLQFVNPQKRFHNWEHTTLANADRIFDEKTNGYSTQEFLMDGSLTGKWQVNVKYQGNKRLGPSYLKATIYHNYGRTSQRKEVKVFRLGLKNVNQKLFELFNSSSISSN